MPPTKSDTPRRSRGSHLTRRHGAPPAEPPPTAPEPGLQGASLPVMVGGLRIADLILAPAANLPASADISATLSELRGWLVLGAEIAATGPDCIALAKAVARRRDSLFRYLGSEEDREPDEDLEPDEDPRLVAIRQAGSISRAAARLGMSHVALSQWLGRRRGSQ